MNDLIFMLIFNKRYKILHRPEKMVIFDRAAQEVFLNVLIIPFSKVTRHTSIVVKYMLEYEKGFQLVEPYPTE